MDNEHYYNIYNYILLQQTLAHFTKKQKQQLFSQSKNYNIENELLYKQDRKDATKFYRVIQKQELPALLYMMHNDPTSGHFATNAMFHKIKARYYWPQYYEDIKKYVQECDACQRRGRSKETISYILFPYTARFIKLESILLDLYLVRKGERNILLLPWI